MESRIFFDGADCRISAVDFGNQQGSPMVLIHGMRDHALSMSSIAAAFPEYHVVAMDLRGHGDSDNTGSYSMAQLVADLRALVDFFKLSCPVLVGHSLGGHIASKFAALYPEDVSRLILIDGMGPPRRASNGKQHVENWRKFVSAALELKGERRVMQDDGEARVRLMRNNPKLIESTATLIAEHGVEEVIEGGVRWKWDSRVAMVWGTFSHDESEVLYSHIQCPVQIISGENSLDYWTKNLVGVSDQQAHHDADIERRRGLFKDAEHISIPGAGHMIHYDEPDALNAVIRKFLSLECS